MLHGKMCSSAIRLSYARNPQMIIGFNNKLIKLIFFQKKNEFMNTIDGLFPSMSKTFHMNYKMYRL